VPLQDGQGDLIGALNISGRGFLSPAPTLALLELVAQNIENRALLASYRHEHFLLRFHARREFVSTAGEAILAIDRNGTIIAANRSAVAALNAPARWALCGRTGAEALGLELSQIERLAKDGSHDPQLLQPLPFFAVVQMPPQRSTRGRPEMKDLPPSDPLAQAERDALMKVLEGCGWNVSHAATQLKLSRRTLHRKMRRHGLRRTWIKSSPA